MAREYGLELTYHEDFQQIFVNEREDTQFSELLTRMKVVDAAGDTEMTVDQWEAASALLRALCEVRVLIRFFRRPLRRVRLHKALAMQASALDNLVPLRSS